VAGCGVIIPIAITTGYSHCCCFRYSYCYYYYYYHYYHTAAVTVPLLLLLGGDITDGDADRSISIANDRLFVSKSISDGTSSHIA
jgi:hypothetical protein